jgi:hypothetical protein
MRAGGDELARGGEHLQALVGGNVGRKRLDRTEANADIALGPEALAGIEHLSALDDEVELVVRPHRSHGWRGPKSGS